MAGSVFGAGGRVKYVPPKVRFPDVITLIDEDVLDDVTKSRDDLINEMIDIDDKFDIIEQAIDDQLKDMRIPAPDLSESISALGGDGRHITKDVLDKAEKIFDNISNLELKFQAQVGEDEKLFGSVTSIDISKKLKEMGYEIDKRKIVLDSPIKSIGDFEVQIKLDEGLTPTIKVTVEKE